MLGNISQKKRYNIPSRRILLRIGTPARAFPTYAAMWDPYNLPKVFTPSATSVEKDPRVRGNLRNEA